jgi:type IV secretory pathway component VirB8
MREYIYIIVFVIGLISTSYQRYKFETITKKNKDKDYCRLYRENNNIFLVIYLALIIDNILQLN